MEVEEEEEEEEEEVVMDSWKRVREVVEGGKEQ